LPEAARCSREVTSFIQADFGRDPIKSGHFISQVVDINSVRFRPIL